MIPFRSDPPNTVTRDGACLAMPTIAEREIAGQPCEECGAWLQRQEVWDEEAERYRVYGTGPWAMGIDWALCSACKKKEFRLRRRDRDRYMEPWEHLRGVAR